MLNNALDLDISEESFWSMTFAELNRLANSKLRKLKRQAQEKATFDYIQAQLIVRGVSNVLGSKEEYPALEQVYSSIFKDEEQVKVEEEQRKKVLAELSAIRFRQYANFHNKKYEEVAKEK